ncbi:hypothetical protein [Streptomyces buecherae]|uniref:hypothetical protein n=1 Tax=Streptomyces buecherae TaxID=2763006 RepID=UPI001C252CC5|nr:hypothetical protein [Streptomyces buecherae]
MTHTTGPVRYAADLAESLLTHADAELGRSFTILTYEEGSGLVDRRTALQPVYEAVVARVGQPKLLGGTTYGPSVRWSNRERTLLLSGDHSEATLSAHPGESFAREEFWRFDSGSLPYPYTWQLDRHGPGRDHGWTFHGHAAADDWTSAEEGLAGLLASWAEHLPVQAPGDWAGFKLWAARDWGRTMIVSFDPSETNAEFHVAIEDKDHEQTLERAVEMRARGWRDVDEHRWWRTKLPVTDPTAAAELARVVITDLRARGTVCPDEVTAWDISAGDNGELWVPGIGVDVSPRRGEHH